MKKLALIAAVFTFLVILALAGPLAAAPKKYYYQDLGTLSGGPESDAYAINNAGQVAGEALKADYKNRAFLQNPGQPMQDLGVLYENPNSYSMAYGINDSGQVVGQATATGGTRAFLKTPGEPMENLGIFFGATFESRAYGINNAGHVVGMSYDTSGNGTNYKAFLKDVPGQPMKNLGALGGLCSEAYDINNAGQIVGWADNAGGQDRAFLKDPDPAVMTDLGTLGGAESCARAINDAGQIVGQAMNAAGKYRAFLKNPGQPLQDLGVLSDSPTAYSMAFAINRAGQVVGSSFDASYRAFLWENGVMYDLNNLLIDPLYPTIILTYARGINDKGDIVGITFDNRAFLLTPEPTGYVPLGLILE